jgi:hypothetical protein
VWRPSACGCTRKLSGRLLKELDRRCGKGFYERTFRVKLDPNVLAELCEFTRPEFESGDAHIAKFESGDGNKYVAWYGHAHMSLYDTRILVR